MESNQPARNRVRPGHLLLIASLVYWPIDLLLCAPHQTVGSSTPVSLFRDSLFRIGMVRDRGIAFSHNRGWEVDAHGQVALTEDPNDYAEQTGRAWARVHYRWGGLVHQLWFSERGEYTFRDDGMNPLTPEQLAQLTRLMADEIASGQTGRNGSPLQRQLAIDALIGNPRTVTEWYWHVLVLDAVFIASATYILWTVLAWRARRRRAKSA